MEENEFRDIGINEKPRNRQKQNRPHPGRKTMKNPGTDKNKTDPTQGERNLSVIVMAGTGDARRIISRLSEILWLEVTATTTTEHGSRLAEKAGASRTVTGALDSDGLRELILDLGAAVLIDATHPFAVQATGNALRACRDTGTVYVRFERPEVNPEGVIRVDSFREAGEVASSLLDDGEVVMHLAGVSTLDDVLRSLEPERVAVRVLPSTSSIEKCLQLGVPASQIIAMQGRFSAEMNLALLREYRAGAVITKESGETGGLPEKVEAASELGIPVILVERPKMNLEEEAVFSDITGLIEYVLKILRDIRLAGD